MALALALCCGAATVVPAAQNPEVKAARKRSKQNRKALAKRAKSGKSVRSGKYKPAKFKPGKARKSK
jgi:hypothetical protein